MEIGHRNGLVNYILVLDWEQIVLTASFTIYISDALIIGSALAIIFGIKLFLSYMTDFVINVLSMSFLMIVISFKAYLSNEKMFIFIINQKIDVILDWYQHQ